jgi:hypothetical protein
MLMKEFRTDDMPVQWAMRQVEHHHTDSFVLLSRPERPGGAVSRRF